MKIISGWRDYYDHVAHQYGGGDPKVVYNRDFAVPDRVMGGEKYEDTLELGTYAGPDMPSTMQIRHANIKEVQRHEFRALVVMERVFIIERHGDIGELGGISRVRKDWHVTTRTILALPYNGSYALLRNGEELHTDRKYDVKRMAETLADSSNFRYITPQGRKSEKARSLCIQVGSPVFVVDGRRNPCVMGRTLKLSSLGVAAYITPEQLYQELAMFVGNVLKPVEQPPSNMTDKEKVESHGFDKKISFRHRK